MKKLFILLLMLIPATSYAVTARMYMFDRNFNIIDQASWVSGSTELPWGIVHIEGTRFIVTTFGGAPIQCRVELIDYRGGAPKLIKTLGSPCGSLGDIYDATFDDRIPYLVYFPDAAANYQYDGIDWDMNLVVRNRVNSTHRGPYFNGLHHIIVTTSGTAIMYLRRANSLFPAKTIGGITSPDGITSDGKHLYVVNGGSTIRKYDYNGNLIASFTASGGAFTGITFNGKNFFAVDPLT